MKALTLIVLSFAILISVAAKADPSSERLYTPVEVADELDNVSSELKALDPNGGLEEVVFLCKMGCTLQYMACTMNIGMICGLRDRNCKKNARARCRTEQDICERNCERER